MIIFFENISAYSKMRASGNVGYCHFMDKNLLLRKIERRACLFGFFDTHLLLRKTWREYGTP